MRIRSSQQGPLRTSRQAPRDAAAPRAWKDGAGTAAIHAETALLTNQHPLQHVSKGKSPRLFETNKS